MCCFLFLVYKKEFAKDNKIEHNDVMDKVTEIDRGGVAFSSTGHENRYLGYDVAEERLPFLLHDLSRKIDVAWEEVLREKGSSDLFDYKSYRQVASKMPELSMRAQALALQFSKSEDPEQREEGMKILFHTHLGTVLGVVDRFSELGPSREELLERGILATVGIIKRFKSGKTPLNNRINRVAAYASQEALVDYFDVPTGWVRKGYMQKIPLWADKFYQEHGRLPEAKEVAQEFRIDEKEAWYQLEKDILATRGKDRPPRLLVAEEEDLRPREFALIQQRVEKALTGLRGREAKVLRMRFGFSPYDREYTSEEIAVECKVTEERIMAITGTALRRLRYSKFRKLNTVL